MAAKIVGGLLGVLILVLVVLRFTGWSPIGNKPGPGNYPGLWLRGDAVSTPVADWSFARQYATDKLETRTPYLIPHSVTTGFVVYNRQLYITSLFGKSVPYPQGKRWVSNVVRDPRVRVKFGNNLYDCVLTEVSDPAEKAAVLQERSKNLAPGALAGGSGSVMHLFHAVSD